MPELFVPGVVIAQDGFFGQLEQWLRTADGGSSEILGDDRWWADTLVKLSSTAHNICV